MQVTSLSNTTFMFDGHIVDTVVMAYDARNCGGARIHSTGNRIMTLTAIADEIHRGMPADVDTITNVLKHFTKS